MHISPVVPSCPVGQREAEEARQRTEGPTGGFLNLGRMDSMDEPNADMTPLLIAARKKREAEAAARAEALAAAEASRSRPVNTVLLKPTKAEAKRLDRTGRMLKRAAVAVAAATELTPEQAAAAAAEVAKYEALKREFQAWNLSFIALGGATAYLAYSRDIAASYLAGALGGYFYLRLLNKSVDSFGSSGLAAGAGSLASQPRLLIPLALALGYNRWNTLAAEEAGLTLQLLPMLVGFFTYKLAVVARQSLELMRELSVKPKSE